MKKSCIKTILFLVMVLVAVKISALISNRAEADSLALVILNNDLSSSNVYAVKSELNNITSFELYRDIGQMDFKNRH